MSGFRPTATLERLARRADALALTRRYFAGRGVMEVDVPSLVQAPVSDVNLHVGVVQLPGTDAPLYLHTSPEYAMKRLLAAGSGDIYYLGHVYRGSERGRRHNAEFMMLEWYRRGWTLDALMDEVAELVQAIAGRSMPIEHLSYRGAFLREAGLDPLEAPRAALEERARELGLSKESAIALSRDELLDLILGAQVTNRLGIGSLCFVDRFPASQAALARLDPVDPRVAMRFELFCEGLELANGFDELAEAVEQRARFEADLAGRAARSLPVAPLDERFLAALEAGLPACSGVAVGFDRVLMVAQGLHDIGEVMPFTTEHA